MRGVMWENYAALKQLSSNLNKVERFFKNNLSYFESRGLSKEISCILKHLDTVKNVVAKDFERAKQRASKWIDDR